MISVLHQVFHWILVSSIKAGILVALMLLIKTLVRNKLDARWHYAIWALLFLQLVMPWTPSSPLSIYKLVPTTIIKAILPTELGPSPSIELPKPSTGSKSSTAPSTPIVISPALNSKPPSGPVVYLSWKLIELLWLAGVAFFAFRIGIAEYRFRKKLKRARQVSDPYLIVVLKECKRLAGVSRTVTLMETDALKSPALFGVFRTRMLLPTSLASNLTSEQLAHVFLHELVHYQRHDIAVNWLATALRVAHWFNPLLWYGFNRLQEDQELSCDALAIRYLRPEAVQEYGRTLIRVLEFAGPQPSQLISAAGISGGKSLSKRRIKMITLFKKPSFKWSLVGVAAIIVVALVAMTFPKANDTIAKTGTSPEQTKQNDKSPDTTKPGADTSEEQELIIYRNTEYGFNFSLPASWKSYTIITDKWEGQPLGGDEVIESGPMISIRNPEWTSQNQRQDIPIMIFTLEQWNSLQQEKFHIGAAPIGPSELGRNNGYVFALPARYNYAFPTGYEEVEQILNNKPLQTNKVVLKQPDEQTTAAIPADYFPLGKGSTWDYEGEGNEYAAFTREVLFTEGNLAQIMESNGGTVSSKIFQTTGDAVIEIFSQGESYDRINMLQEKSNKHETLLKSPLAVGTKWSDVKTQKEIVDTAATVETPAGTFKDTIKVKITFSESDSIIYEYYAKGVGMVKKEFTSGDMKVTSTLKSYHLVK